jgi:hypothetical protein
LAAAFDCDRRRILANAAGRWRRASPRQPQPPFPGEPS